MTLSNATSTKSQNDAATVHAAIAAVQSELLGKFVTTDEVNAGRYSYKYVSLPELLSTVTPLLHSHGLVAFYHTSQHADSNTLCVNVVQITSGAVVTATWNLGAVQADFKNSGAVLTYYYRRLLMGLLGIHPEEDETEQVVNAPRFAPPPQGVFAPPPFAAAPPQAPAPFALPAPMAPPMAPPQPPHVPSAPPQFNYQRPPQA